MTKMVMIVYNEAIDVEIMEVLENCALKNYTKTTAAFGSGVSSGAHLGNDIWPGRNNILYVASSDTQAKQIMDCIKELRKTLGREGVKAFCWELQDI